MIPALLTLCCWTASAYGSARCARILGSARAWRLRLLLASALLAPVLLLFHGAVTWAWLCFLAAGVLHLGAGDRCLFSAYRRIGPRLALLVGICLAAPVATLAEWLLLGQVPRPAALTAGALILAGVALAVAPGRVRPGPGFRAGLLFASAAAVCQGLGALVTRQGFVWQPDAPMVDSSALRVLGGLAVALLLGAGGPAPQPDAPQRAWSGWMAQSLIFGPWLGILTYQAALAHLPAGQVQAIVACLPLTMVPLAWRLDGDRPGWRGITGAAIAIGGLALMTWG